jgi:hypothetical protein
MLDINQENPTIPYMTIWNTGTYVLNISRSGNVSLWYPSLLVKVTDEQILNVNGSIQVRWGLLFRPNNATTSCGITWGVMFSNSDNELCFCNGSHWNLVSSPGSGCDISSSGTGSIIEEDHG